MIPEKDIKNFFLLIFFNPGPTISLPLGVNLFLSKIELLYLNLTFELSNKVRFFLVNTTILLSLVFLRIQLLGLVLRTLTLTKLPDVPIFLLNPL